jgi:hypothetical protein
MSEPVVVCEVCNLSAAKLNALIVISHSNVLIGVEADASGRGHVVRHTIGESDWSGTAAARSPLGHEK